MKKTKRFLRYRKREIRPLSSIISVKTEKITKNLFAVVDLDHP